MKILMTFIVAGLIIIGATAHDVMRPNVTLAQHNVILSDLQKSKDDFDGAIEVLDSCLAFNDIVTKKLERLTEKKVLMFNKSNKKGFDI